MTVVVVDTAVVDTVAAEDTAAAEEVVTAEVATVEDTTVLLLVARLDLVTGSPFLVFPRDAVGR